jgi:hypothetical protein
MLFTLLCLLIYFAIAILIVKIVFWLVGMAFPVPDQIQKWVYIIIGLVFLVDILSCFFYHGQPWFFGPGSWS